MATGRKMPATSPIVLRDVLRVADGFELAGVDPASTPGFDGGKTAGTEALQAGVEELAALQERLFAGGVSDDSVRSLLLVVQGMDTAGKGGIVRHVVGAVDPQGIH